jgi:hypothetical protein
MRVGVGEGRRGGETVDVDALIGGSRREETFICSLGGGDGQTPDGGRVSFEQERVGKGDVLFGGGGSQTGVWYGSGDAVEDAFVGSGHDLDVE